MEADFQIRLPSPNLNLPFAAPLPNWEDADFSGPVLMRLLLTQKLFADAARMPLKCCACRRTGP